jgi:DNA-binding transcriptional LysR family regulator
MDIRSFDLNLLVVLQALISEQSVSRAATKLHLSQPATSAALKRLRSALGDPLLVRDGLTMVLTPKAQQLLIPLEKILSEIGTLDVATPFDPASVDRTIRIATNDYGAFILIPSLMNRLQHIAPGIDVEIWEIGRDAPAALNEGKIDLAIADSWTLRECKSTEVLFPETFTCLVRSDHPRIQTQLTLKDYLAQKHVLVSPRGRVEGNVDEILAKQGFQRHVRLTLPHVLAVPAAIAATDDIVTLASRIAHALATHHQLQLFPPPIELDRFTIAMAWKARMANDPAIKWLRDELVAIGQILKTGH